jgi:hypothetical protein
MKNERGEVMAFIEAKNLLECDEGRGSCKGDLKRFL